MGQAFEATAHHRLERHPQPQPLADLAVAGMALPIELAHLARLGKVLQAVWSHSLIVSSLTLAQAVVAQARWAFRAWIVAPTMECLVAMA